MRTLACFVFFGIFVCLLFGEDFLFVLWDFFVCSSGRIFCLFSGKDLLLFVFFGNFCLFFGEDLLLFVFFRKFFCLLFVFSGISCLFFGKDLLCSLSSVFVKDSLLLFVNLWLRKGGEGNILIRCSCRFSSKGVKYSYSP